MQTTREDLHGIDKALGTHLAECAAAHRAQDLRLSAVGDSITAHIKSTETFREAMLKKNSDMQKLILLGILLSLLFQTIGTEQITKILLSLIKVTL